MCGIVAARGDFTDSDGKGMLERLAHRGPDGKGAVRVGDAWLGHTRLAIVDVAGGQQPIVAHDGAAMVGNGEIYNHQDLRADLPAEDFTTDSDNEVALHLVRHHGPAALERLWGMFAVAVATADGQLVAARDPLGIKPLYLAQHGGTVLLASELKAFSAEWLPYVEAFPPGHWWTYEAGFVPFGTEWEPHRVVTGEHGTDEDPTSEDLAQLRQSLVTAVQRRLMADVPVGVFLSGGLDSSLIGAIAAREAAQQGKVLHSFAVGMEGSADLEAARVVAEHLGTVHHERVVTPEDLVAALPRTVVSIESFDPMLVHSAVMNDLLAEHTARHVKVVLTGEGADELFAGYDYLKEIDAPGTLHQALVEGVSGLHNLNLQRCDRVTMAHGLEARVPFLDLDVIRTALALPAAWKVSSPDRPEKWLLRQAFDGWLPDALLWRSKEQFGDGTGSSDVLRAHVEEQVDEAELAARRDEADPPLRTAEEAYYWRLFAPTYQGVDTSTVVGRFADA